jgi:aminoglycoside/choline kinase family phosphotransferase
MMEDLGSDNLQESGSTGDRSGLYERVIELLFLLQKEGSAGFDTSWCCQTETYDAWVMRRLESDYFRNAFLVEYLGLKRTWPELERPFDHIAESAAAAPGGFLLHRDFQSRNIMVSGERLGIIDWQGARLGPRGYDLASLLIDPYASLTAREKEHAFRHYLELLGREDPDGEENLKRSYPYLALQRNLQILGAFSFLSRARGKTYFEAYIPPALHSLHDQIHDLRDPILSPLSELVDLLVDLVR